MRARHAIVSVAFAANAAMSCGGTRLPAAGAGAKDDDAARIAAFQHVEDEVLRDLAAIDRRIAIRARIDVREEDLRRVTMAALLAEDTSIAVVDGAIDPFSFEARGRGLAAARTKISSVAELPTGARGMLPSPALERELLLRLVEEEIVRLEEERALPRSASALVRGILDTWSSPGSSREAASRDRWLARRLKEVGASLTLRSLDVVRARELDDALDGLEHAIDAAHLGHATVELVKLREELEAQSSRPAAGAVSDWSDVERGIRAHLGYALTPAVLDRRLAAAEIALRSAAEKAMARTPHGAEAAAARGAALVLGSEPCVMAVPGSRLRSMAPSPQRGASCRLRHALTSATDDAARITALVAMHDHVVVALWALDVALGKATIASATSKHRPMSMATPDIIARWERIALARATTAIGGGLAAEVLSRSADPAERARVWSELGEVPLDIAERELRDGDGSKR